MYNLKYIYIYFNCTYFLFEYHNTIKIANIKKVINYYLVFMNYYFIIIYNTI